VCEKFLRILEEKGIFLCPYMDMEEKNCKYYRENMGKYTGGFCTCCKDCHCCDEKEWHEELGIPVDKDFKIREESKKLLDIEKNNRKITEFI